MPFGDLAFTPSGKKALELSLRESLYLGHDYIGTEHLLLGLIREEKGVAAQVLVTMGAELTRVRQQVTRLLHEYYGEATTAPPQRADPTRQEADRPTQGRQAAQDMALTQKATRARFGLLASPSEAIGFLRLQRNQTRCLLSQALHINCKPA